MDKIVKVLVLLSLFIISCSKKTNYDENINNMKFVIEKYITIDLKKEKLLLDYYGLKYEDSIIFTKAEKDFIINFFNKCDLNGKKGKFWYMDENSTSASLHDEIIILKNNKIQSKFVINSNRNSTSSSEENEIKIFNFMNYIKKTIKKKNSYQKVNNSLKGFIKRKPILLM